MAHYQIYIPGPPNGPERRLGEVGLGDLIGRHEPMDCLNGPDGTGGLLVSWRPDDPSQRTGFFPKEQTWVKNATGQYFVGFWNDAPPHPVELERADTHDGYAVPLQDGNKWAVPAAVWLPKDVILGVNDAKSQVKPEHFDFWEEAKRWVRDFLVMDKNSAPEYLPQMAQYVYRALALNYRLTIEVVNHLRLFDERSILDCLRATLDGLILDEIIDEKKNEDSAPTPDT